MRQKSFAALALGGIALPLALLGCGGISSGGFDCAQQSGAYEETAAQQGLLQNTIPDNGPYPMALVLSTDAINTLLSTVLDQNLPMVSEDIAGGLLSVKFQPSLPKIQIAAVEGCASCVLTSMEFEVQAGNNLLGFSNGRGAATLSLPISLAPKGNRSTALMAQMDEATFQSIELDIAGISSSDFQTLEDFLTDLATEYLQQELGSQEISTINSWELGQGEMALAARGPQIFPNQGTILVGLNSNLVLPEATTLEEQATLPEGSQIGLQIHPGMLLSVSQRLMNEGEIASTYDGSGNEDEEGQNQVTLTTMQTTENDELNTIFRIWRTGGGLCGYVDMSSSMSLNINSEAVQIDVSDLEIIDGSGSGQLLSENTWLASDLLQSLADNLSLTMNYNDFAVEGDRMKATPQASGVSIDGKGLSVFLNLGLEEKEE